ncbi:MAG: hypothetical protein U0935_02155 [Pirellulales bacterium]
MFIRWLRQAGKFVQRPGVQLSVSLILIVASTIEIIESFDEDLKQLRLGVHHGMLILGMVNMLAAVPDLVEGLERLEETSSEKTATSEE